jgi:hypothetical protein
MKNLAEEKMHEMGVSYPVLINPEAIGPEDIVIPVPKRHGDVAGAGKAGGGAGVGVPSAAAPAAEKKVQVQRFRFRVQFIWQPKSAAERAAPRANTGSVAAVPATSTSPNPHKP